MAHVERSEKEHLAGARRGTFAAILSTEEVNVYLGGGVKEPDVGNVSRRSPHSREERKAPVRGTFEGASLRCVLSPS